MVGKISLKIRRITKLDIVKVFSLTSISTFVQMVTSLISVKIVSVIIGPGGIALIGQLNNFSSIIMSFATGGINSGVVKLIAESKNDEEKIEQLIGTAAKIILTLSGLLGILLVIFSDFLSKRILLNAQYSFIYIIFGITLLFYTSNSLLLSILNGFKQFNTYVKISIFSSLFGLLISLCLVLLLGVKGALINAVTSQSFLFLISLYIVKKKKYFWFDRKFVFSGFKSTIAKQYLKFSLMTLVSALTVPVAQLIVRTYLIHKFSFQQAGYWEAMNKISNMYLGIIISAFGVYYLPRLSELNDSHGIKKEIRTAFKVVIPILIVLLPVIYFSRELIIRLLFSKEFYMMKQLFFWQLCGDFFKIVSWLIAYLMVAKSMIKLYISTEIIFSLSFVGLTYALCPVFGLQGVVMAYSFNYATFLILMFFVVYRKI